MGLKYEWINERGNISFYFFENQRGIFSMKQWARFLLMILVYHGNTEKRQKIENNGSLLLIFKLQRISIKALIFILLLACEHLNKKLFLLAFNKNGSLPNTKLSSTLSFTSWAPHPKNPTYLSLFCFSSLISTHLHKIPNLLFCYHGPLSHQSLPKVNSPNFNLNWHVN